MNGRLKDMMVGAIAGMSDKNLHFFADLVYDAYNEAGVTGFVAAINSKGVCATAEDGIKLLSCIEPQSAEDVFDFLWCTKTLAELKSSCATLLKELDDNRRMLDTTMDKALACVDEVFDAEKARLEGQLAQLAARRAELDN